MTDKSKNSFSNILDLSFTGVNKANEKSKKFPIPDESFALIKNISMSCLNKAISPTFLDTGMALLVSMHPHNLGY